MDDLSDYADSLTPSKRCKLCIALIMMASLTFAVGILVNVMFIKYNLIHVHLIPHSHDDVGWLKTPEEYYKTYVKYILDHVVIELEKNDQRKFVYVEMYFFWRWWKEQTDTVQAVVRKLIYNKQLEIINGGWCMSDEATVHYQSFIDQSTWGLRIDADDRQYRKANKLMEFIWQGNETCGDDDAIFTSVLYDHYSSPVGFDFETIPNQNEIDYSAFFKFVRKQSLYFKTDHILVPMGDDFRFINARKYFDKMDLLIKYFTENQGYGVNVFYSTPSFYLRCLYNTDLKWPRHKEDFFPYSAEHGNYWSGFYTSRPTLKYFERISNNFLQITKQLFTQANLGDEFENELTNLREAVGVLQHHDAITGTAQQHVSNHYSKLLYEGIANCTSPVNKALGKLSSHNKRVPRPIYTSCLLLNISSCKLTETSPRFVVTIYNPNSRKVDHYVRIPVGGKRYSVITSQGREVKSQILSIPKSVRDIPGRESTAKVEIIFRATGIPALGFKSFYVFRKKSNRGKRNSKKFGKRSVEILFDVKTQLLSEVITNTGNWELNQTIKYYEAAEYSGAYIFKPINNGLRRLNFVRTTLINTGDIVKEYEQTFSSWASQIIRLYKDEDYVEFEWLVGPIPMEDAVGKEVVSVYSSNILSGRVFYTDANGMFMEKRIRNYRTWRKKISATISGNYFPVTTMISVKDSARQMYIVIDRPQGGSSLNSGEIELMLHRRLCTDDGRGVQEALNETAFGDVGLVVRGRHWLMFGNNDDRLDAKVKLFSQSRHLEPWLFFFDASKLPFQVWRNNYVTEFFGLYSYIPRNVRVLTLEPWREDTVLLRLEHIFKKFSTVHLYNEPAMVSLRDLFRNFEILEARETSLGADRWKHSIRKPKWRSAGTPHKVRQFLGEESNEEFISGVENMTITLKPLEIRTFIVRIKARD